MAATPAPAAPRKTTGTLESWVTWALTLAGVLIMGIASQSLLTSTASEAATRQLLSDTRAGAAVLTSQATVIALGNDNWKSMGETLGQVRAAYELLGRGGPVGNTEVAPVSGVARANWSQAGQPLTTLEGLVRNMQEDQPVVTRGTEASSRWLDLLRATASGIETAQRQNFARQEPWFGMLARQRDIVEHLPRTAAGLQAADATALAQANATLEEWSKNADPSINALTGPLVRNWQDLSAAATATAATQPALLRLQALQPKLLAASVAFQKSLVGTAGNISSNGWMRWVWVGLGALMAFFGVSLLLYFSRDWVQQASRGRIQARRQERLESAAQDMVRQVEGLFVGDALRLNATLELPEDRASVLTPVATGVNRALVLISRLLGQAEQRLGEISTATQEGEGHVRPLLGFAHDYNDLMGGLVQRVESFQHDIEQARQSWSELQLRTQQMGQRGTHGREIVQASQASTDGARQTLQDAAKRIKRMGESTQGIIQNTSLIRNLTLEMHVLSTNAAIESAAVGEKGRKFGVVAKEIQRLSKSTGETISQIEQQVRQVQEDAQGAISSMEASTGGVARSARHNDQAAETLRDLQQIVDGTDALAQSLSHLLTGLMREARGWQEQVGAGSLRSEEIHHHVLSTSASLEKSQQALDQLRRTTSSLSTPD
jgi:methyl-accepting chemotaxis protein